MSTTATSIRRTLLAIAIWTGAFLSIDQGAAETEDPVHTKPAPAAEASTSRPYASIPEILRIHLRAGTKKWMYVRDVLIPFKDHVANLAAFRRPGQQPRDGRGLTREDVAELHLQVIARARMHNLQRFYEIDTEGRGRVSIDAWVASLRNIYFNQSFIAELLPAIKSADRNGDGMLDVDEARDVPAPISGDNSGRAWTLRAYFELLPDEQVMTAEILTKLAEANFAIVDVDGDGELSNAEYAALNRAVPFTQPRPFYDLREMKLPPGTKCAVSQTGSISCQRPTPR